MFYNKQVENVYIPNGVKEIKEGGFEKCFRLRNIEFSDSLNKNRTIWISETAKA